MDVIYRKILGINCDMTVIGQDGKVNGFATGLNQLTNLQTIANEFEIYSIKPFFQVSDATISFRIADVISRWIFRANNTDQGLYIQENSTTVTIRENQTFVVPRNAQPSTGILLDAVGVQYSADIGLVVPVAASLECVLELVIRKK